MGSVTWTIASFDWESAARMSPPAVVVWLHPSKDPTQRKRRYCTQCTQS